MLKKKISTKIAFIIGAVEIVTMVLLFIVTNSNLTGTIEAKSVNDLAVIAKDRALVLETYFQGYSNFMELYSKSTEIRNVLQNPEDKEASLMPVHFQVLFSHNPCLSKYPGFISRKRSSYCFFVISIVCIPALLI